VHQFALAISASVSCFLRSGEPRAIFVRTDDCAPITAETRVISSVRTIVRRGVAARGAVPALRVREPGERAYRLQVPELAERPELADRSGRPSYSPSPSQRAAPPDPAPEVVNAYTG